MFERFLPSSESRYSSRYLQQRLPGWSSRMLFASDRTSPRKAMRSSGDASAGKGLETSNMMEGKRVRDVREELWVPGEEEKRRKVECAAGGRARSRSLTETKRQSFSATECILYFVHDVSSDPPPSRMQEVFFPRRHRTIHIWLART